MPKKPEGQKKVERATERSVERALREERLALAAITKVMLLEVADPARVLARLDAMVRAAEASPKTPAATRRMLLDGVRFVRTAIERETGRPQSLFDPHVGHTQPAAVDALVNPTDGPVQLGLVTNESILGDVETAHEERVRTIAKVHEALVKILLADGAATDLELWTRYHFDSQADRPAQSRGAIKDRRKELCAAGRVVRAKARNGEPAWDVVERELLEAS